MTISLGGGSNILNLTKDLSTAQIPNLHFYLPSEITRMQCKKLGLSVLPLNDTMSKFYLAFDGCIALIKISML